MEVWGIPWWVIALAAVGAVSIVSAVLTLFVPLNRPPHYSLTSCPAPGSDEFMQAAAGVVNAPMMKGGTARLLNNGVEIFPALTKALREAECTIDFMVYIWKDGAASDQLIEVLEERARAGVQVRLMLDALGAARAPRDKLERITEAGGKLAFFQPFRFGRMTAVYKRNHRRAMIVDGRVAFTGGAAVDDIWLGDAQDAEHWRDVMVEIHGCLATNLQSAFSQLWAATTGEILVGENFYPTDHDEEDEREGPGEALSRHIHVTSSPNIAAQPLRVFFFLSMSCARESIYITNPYFAPGDEIRESLKDRARDGADVRLLVPGRHTDAPYVRYAAHAFYQEMMEAGVRIYEYQPTMLHAKMLVVDGQWSVVGSANMDVRSKELNQEAVIGVLDKGFGQQLVDTFHRDLDDAREITLDEWKTRGPLAQLRERFWLAFVNQM